MQESIDLSIIVCGRNDNYGGNFLNRVNVFISSITILSHKHNVNSEIIFVEWNPVEGVPFIHEELLKNKALNKYKQKIRFIQVSAEIHKQFPNRKIHLPVLDYVGKNVGIRRAKGKFILVCSPDIIFRDDFFAMWRKDFFSDKYIYRAVRLDVTNGKEIPSDENEHDKLLTSCYSSVINMIHVTFPAGLYYNEQSNHRIELNKPYLAACGDFLLMAKDNWFKIKGCPETNRSHQFAYLDGAILHAALKHCEQWILSKAFTIYHQNHARPHHIVPESEEAAKGYNNVDNWGLIDKTLPEIIFPN